MNDWVELNDKRLRGKYEVNNSGVVRNKINKKELKAFETNSGYLMYNLTSNHYHLYPHRLVATHFIDKFRGKKVCVNHKNGNKKDNRLENLEICTYSENHIHSHRVLGNKVHNIALTRDKAVDIREKYKAGGISQKKLGEMFGVSTMLINRIINFIQHEYR